MKLAHFSDLHVTHFPLSAGFTLKRLLAVGSYTLMGRGRHFEQSDARIAALLEDVDALGVDHALCTGDLTGVSGVAEFERCAQLFGPRLSQPKRFTVLPGNHDRYVEAAARSRLFERHFGGLCGGAAFPLVKDVGAGVTVVGLDSARPCSLTDSSGLLGKAQRQKALEVLTDRSLEGRFVVVALHYGLLRKTGQRDARHHGLRDDLELTALVDRPDVFVDLVVHGHMHTAYTVRTARRLTVNAGSATDLHARCGYNVYDIDAAAHRVTGARRTWSAASGRYEAEPSGATVFDVTTR